MTNDGTLAFIAHLERRYLTGLFAIALLSVGSHVSLQTVLGALVHDAQLVNTAGRATIGSRCRYAHCPRRR